MAGQPEVGTKLLHQVGGVGLSFIEPGDVFENARFQYVLIVGDRAHHGALASIQHQDEARFVAYQIQVDRLLDECCLQEALCRSSFDRVLLMLFPQTLIKHRTNRQRPRGLPLL